MVASRSKMAAIAFVGATAPLAGGLCSFTSVQDASRSWKDSRDGKDHFQLLLRVPDPWRPFAHVMLEWPDVVEITSAMGASLTRKAGTCSAPHLSCIADCFHHALDLQTMVALSLSLSSTAFGRVLERFRSPGREHSMSNQPSCAGSALSIGCCFAPCCSS
jgi:hypothetical protein